MRTLLLTLSASCAAESSNGDNFDVRTAWRGCATQVLAQGACASCWAFGSTSAMSDRFCINGHTVLLSPQSLVSCGCKGDCGGGLMFSAYAWMASDGVQSCKLQCHTGCEPYNMGGRKPASCTSDPHRDKCHGCDKQCHNGERATFFKVKDVKSSGLDSNQAAVMQEIRNHGSITTTMVVYKNWDNWVKNHGKHAVYDSHEGSARTGGHAISIIGFGVSKGKNYWLVQNSWGPSFGDRGYIKMLRGGGKAAGIIGQKCFWATPIMSSEMESGEALSNATSQISDLEEDDEFVGGWSDGDIQHPYFQTLAEKVFAQSDAGGTFGNLERVETQVIAGFNARFTVTTTDGSQVVLESSHDMHGEMMGSPLTSVPDAVV